MAMMLKQSTAVDVLIGPFVDKADGASAENSESPTVKLSKNGGALAAKNDATTPSFSADGYYICDLNATDTNTVGTLVLTVAASATALPVRHEFQVVAANVYDSLYAASGTDILQVETTTNSDKTGYTISGTKTTLDALNDIAATDIVSGGAITTSSGAVSNVTTVATTTTNTDMRGTDSAYTGTPPTTAQIATAILGMTYESSEDFQDYLRLTRAVLLGKTTGAGTGSENFRDEGDNKNRVAATIDSNGNRTAITTDAT